MTPEDPFPTFIHAVLVPARAERYATLAAGARGRRRILDALYHDFDAALRPECIRDEPLDALDAAAGLIYHAARGWGIPCDTVAAAREDLALDDGWLILLRDGSAGLYRPEGRDDDTRVIRAP